MPERVVVLTGHLPPGASLSGVAAEARDGAPAGSSRGLADARRSVPRPDLQQATTASPGSGVATLSAFPLPLQCSPV